MKAHPDDLNAKNALGQTPGDVAGCEYIKDIVQPFSTVGTSYHSGYSASARHVIQNI
jgi:hypothetical protein